MIKMEQSFLNFYPVCCINLDFLALPSFDLSTFWYDNLGWALWNRKSSEFKFDDTRLSSYHKKKIGSIKNFLLRPDFAKFLPCWLSQYSQVSMKRAARLTTYICSKASCSFNRDLRVTGLILFLYYEESMVSSNLNSKQLWFHSVRPIVHTYT